MKWYQEPRFWILTAVTSACLGTALYVTRPAEAQVPQDRTERYLERIARSLERIAHQPVCECECR